MPSSVEKKGEKQLVSAHFVEVKRRRREKLKASSVRVKWRRKWNVLRISKKSIRNSCVHERQSG